jgi:hypothetical protein
VPRYIFLLWELGAIGHRETPILGTIGTLAPDGRAVRSRFLDPLHPYASTMRHNVAPLWRANWNLKARYASYKKKKEINNQE